MPVVREVVAAGVAAALIIILKKRKKRKRPIFWQSNYLESRSLASGVLSEVRELDKGRLFKNFTRMTTTDFDLLLAMILPAISKKDTQFREAIPGSTRLAVTLRYLATGDSYHSLMYQFKISVPSISRIIPQVCSAISEVLKDYVKVR